jgi:hypothetical protein
MPNSEHGSRDDRPILHPQLDDENEGLQLFEELPDSNPSHAVPRHFDDSGLIDLSWEPDAAEQRPGLFAAVASGASPAIDHQAGDSESNERTPQMADSIDWSEFRGSSIDEDPSLRTPAGRIWSRIAGVLTVLNLIVLSPVLLPFFLFDEGRWWFRHRILLSYLGGQPKSGWVYGVLYPITPRRSIRDGEKVLRVLHWAFQQRGQEWASLAMVRDASAGRLRWGLTEVMAMLEDGGELQVQWFRTNEALGDLAAYTIPHGARQHGLLRAIELYLEFRDEARRIRRFDFKHHFAYRTRMFALTLDYALRQHLDLASALEAAAAERSTTWRHYVSWAQDRLNEGKPAPWGLPVSRCGLFRFEPQFLAMLKAGVEQSGLPSVLQLVVRM